MKREGRGGIPSRGFRSFDFCARAGSLSLDAALPAPRVNRV